MLVVGFATALTSLHLPLPWSGEPRPVLPPAYQLGNWTALVLGLAFTGTYARRVAKEARDLSDALTATELVLAREQHLSQLDGLAAAAAHELGTPLATIALVARELSRLAPAEGEMAEDIALLREQVERCRGILGKLEFAAGRRWRPARPALLAPADRGSGRAAAAFRRAVRDRDAGRKAGAGLPPQSRHDLRSRQYRR